jgi:hypothetical protein
MFGADNPRRDTNFIEGAKHRAYDIPEPDSVKASRANKQFAARAQNMNIPELAFACKRGAHPPEDNMRASRTIHK